jgi:hypothetical protein
MGLGEIMHMHIDIPTLRSSLASNSAVGFRLGS